MKSNKLILEKDNQNVIFVKSMIVYTWTHYGWKRPVKQNSGDKPWEIIWALEHSSHGIKSIVIGK